MSIELTLLVWSTVLLGTYLTTQATLYRMQKGLIHASTARDNEPPPNALTARGEKALRNFLETYGVFIALAVAVELSGRSDALTQWGAHIFGVIYIRTLVWTVAALGLALMFFGVLF